MVADTNDSQGSDRNVADTVTSVPRRATAIAAKGKYRAKNRKAVQGQRHAYASLPLRLKACLSDIHSHTEAVPGSITMRTGGMVAGFMAKAHQAGCRHPDFNCPHTPLAHPPHTPPASLPPCRRSSANRRASPGSSAMAARGGVVEDHIGGQAMLARHFGAPGFEVDEGTWAAWSRRGGGRGAGCRQGCGGVCACPARRPRFRAGAGTSPRSTEQREASRARVSKL